MFNVNGCEVEYHILNKCLDFDKRIGQYGNGLWFYTPREYLEESRSKWNQKGSD